MIEYGKLTDQGPVRNWGWHWQFLDLQVLFEDPKTRIENHN
jgi:hypothetical protein